MIALMRSAECKPTITDGCSWIARVRKVVNKVSRWLYWMRVSVVELYGSLRQKVDTGKLSFHQTSITSYLRTPGLLDRTVRSESCDRQTLLQWLCARTAHFSLWWTRSWTKQRHSRCDKVSHLQRAVPNIFLTTRFLCNIHRIYRVRCMSRTWDLICRRRRIRMYYRCWSRWVRVGRTSKI